MKEYNRKSRYSYESKSVSLPFFFLVFYLLAVLIRPQDFVTSMFGMPLVMMITVTCLLFTIALHKPLVWLPPQTFLLMMLPVIAISAFLNGWGMNGLVESQNILISSIVPLFLFVTLVNSTYRQKIIMIITICSSLVMVHNGWTQFTSPDAFGWAGNQAVGGELRRIIYVGIFSDPNDLGMLLVMNIPFLMYFFYRGGALTKLLCLCLFFIFSYGVYMTGSRGTLLGCTSLIGLYLLLKYGGGRLIIFSIIVGPVVATLLSQFGGLNSGEASARGRLYAWYDGIQYLIGNPLFGVGKGNFFDMHGLTAHNSYILVASELGTLGYTLWGGALTFTVYIGYRIFKVSKSDAINRFDKSDVENREKLKDELLLNNALFFSMIGFLVTAFFLSRSYVLLLFIFIGLSLASHLRVIKMIPELKHLLSYSVLIKCGFASWVMIFMVYFTLKFTL